MSPNCGSKLIKKKRKRKFRIDDLLEEDDIPQKKTMEIQNIIVLKLMMLNQSIFLNVE